MTTSVLPATRFVFISRPVISHPVSASLKHKETSGGSAISAGGSWLGLLWLLLLPWLRARIVGGVRKLRRGKALEAKKNGNGAKLNWKDCWGGGFEEEKSDIRRNDDESGNRDGETQGGLLIRFSEKAKKIPETDGWMLSRNTDVTSDTTNTHKHTQTALRVTATSRKVWKLYRK